MSWKTAHRSFDCQDAPEPEDIVLAPAATVLLVINFRTSTSSPSPIRPTTLAGSRSSSACGGP
jgi:hypothetical protein